MILRQHGGIHYVLCQTEHARQTSVIVSHLRPEFLGTGDEQLDIVMAARHHDDGWRAWEQNPSTDASGLPVDFLAMNQEAHRQIWERTIFQNLHDRGPAITAIIARHGLALIEGHDEPAAAHYRDLIHALSRRAWPALTPEQAALRIERGFSALYFADGLSLLAAAEEAKPRTYVLRRADHSPFEVRAWRECDWTIRVDPWPFCLERLSRIHMDVSIVPVGREATALDAVLHRPERRLRVFADYLPAN